MWEGLILNSQKYLLLKTTHEDIISVLLSDCVFIWSKSYSKDDLLRMFMEYNPFIKSRPESLMEYIMNFLDAKNMDVARELVKEDDSVTLSMSFKKSGFKISFYFTLHKESPEEFYRKFTLPLLLMAGELEYRQKLLTQLLIDKDKEITEYNLEGAAISRKSVKTKKFDIDQFEIKCLEGLGARASQINSGNYEIITQKLYDDCLRQSKDVDRYNNGRNTCWTSVHEVSDVKDKKLIKPSIITKIVKTGTLLKSSRLEEASREDEVGKRESTIKRVKRKNNTINL